MRFCDGRELRRKLEHLRRQVTEYNPYFDVVVRFACSKDPETRGSSCVDTGKVSYAGQAKGKRNTLVLHFGFGCKIDKFTP